MYAYWVRKAYILEVPLSRKPHFYIKKARFMKEFQFNTAAK